MSKSRAQGPIFIAGAVGGTNIGASLFRAADALGAPAHMLDTRLASSRVRLLQSISWRLGHRPFHMRRFGRMANAECSRFSSGILISTGAAPLTAEVLRRLRAAGIRTINYSTDDPWNPTQRSAWHLKALPEYDVVFTPRRANLMDFRALGCADTRYLPFAFDDDIFGPSQPPPPALGHDLLFVGGADRDRVDFVSGIMKTGPSPALVGAYWERYPETRASNLGQKSPEALRALTAAATVNLCLVRRANRDGHVMRSFEIPAVGGFMLAEDTPEHRDLFGPEGQCTLYFTTPESAAQKARWALDHPEERRRMAQAAHCLVTTGGHTYRDRLQHMLAAVEEKPNPPVAQDETANSGPNSKVSIEASAP